jgi:hypothetical protein
VDKKSIFLPLKFGYIWDLMGIYGKITFFDGMVKRFDGIFAFYLLKQLEQKSSQKLHITFV